MDKPRPKINGPRNRKIFWIWAITINLLVFAIASYLKNTHAFGDISLGLVIFGISLVYNIGLSINTVGPTEVGARLFFGKPLDELDSGLCYIPFGICNLSKASHIFIQDELPADPEHIFRAPRDQPEVVPKELLGIMFPPIRIPFGFPDITDGIPEDDPYNRRMVAEVVPVVTWEIEDYLVFLTRIGSIKEARRQMEDAAVALFMERFTIITPARALKELPTHSEKLKEAIDAKVGDWGINVKGAKIKTIIFSHELNTAIIQVPEEVQKAKVTAIKACAERDKRHQEGIGDGKADEARIYGRTAGFKWMMKDLDVTAQEVLATETTRVITSNPGQKTIVVGAAGFKEILGVVAAVGESLKKEDAV